MNSLYNFVLSKERYKQRLTVEDNLAEEYSQKGLSIEERFTRRLEYLTRLERPQIRPDEKIVFIRTVANIPKIITSEEREKLGRKYYFFGSLGNVAVDFESLIAEGLESRRKKVGLLEKRIIDCMLDLSSRYRQHAEEIGRTDVVKILTRIPQYGAENFKEALQFFRIIHFFMWLSGHIHNVIGRFDQYMYPYLAVDMEKGNYTEYTALELLEDFFLSFNKDNDLYRGIQKGDNGQSMVLGGLLKDGSEGFNLLSKLCLIASSKIKLIDPKINLRVNKKTPLETYILGSELTKIGLGFPQYSNDDVVVPGLVKLGYEYEDAVEYVVAACWEFIIPKFGADIPNVEALSFPFIVDEAVHDSLESSESFDEFMQKIREKIWIESERIVEYTSNIAAFNLPIMNMLYMVNNIEYGAKYNNFGIHGIGIATAVDSLFAIKKYIYDEKKITAHDMIEMLDSDFELHSEWLPILRYETPKMGQDVDEVDLLGNDLLLEFSKSLVGRKNRYGGIYRAGTGSAMYYIWYSKGLGATPDGRRKDEPFGANFSPGLFTKVDGPLSVIRSFTKMDMTKVINGGPLTLEFYSNMLESADSIEKLAQLVEYFIKRGGHQLQLNMVKREDLIDAKQHPEKYQQLIVRVWGWSAYFVDLDKEYQDHIIARQEYVV